MHSGFEFQPLRAVRIAQPNVEPACSVLGVEAVFFNFSIGTIVEVCVCVCVRVSWLPDFVVAFLDCTFEDVIPELASCPTQSKFRTLRSPWVFDEQK